MIRRPKKLGEIDRDTLTSRASYVAGFLDGEGTFTINWNKRTRCPSFHPCIMVSHTNEEVISFLSETLQVDYTPKVRKARRNYYVLRVTTKDEIVMVLEELSDWLIVKKEHAQIIHELIALKEKNKPKQKENVLKQAELYLRIRQLNLKGGRFDPDELRRALEGHIENYFKNK